MKRLEDLIPAFKGREFMAEVTSVTVAEDGGIWGGTREGYLFSINPKDDKVINHGKPGTYYLKGVTVLGDGVYCFGGGNFGDTHLRRYSVKKGFEDMGLITRNLINTAVKGRDGKLYAGEYNAASSIIRYSKDKAKIRKKK